jgi:hypothetical protein
MAPVAPAEAGLMAGPVRGLISGRVAEPARSFAARLAARALALGEARAAALALARRGKSERRWRDPRLLWPLFAGETSRSR